MFDVFFICLILCVWLMIYVVSSKVEFDELMGIRFDRLTGKIKF